MSATQMAKRLRREYEELMRERPAGIRAEPVDDEMTLWRAAIEGPPDSPYAGGLFTLAMKIPSNYPFAPPMVCFLTKIYHPNVSSSTGRICLDTLQGNWSPVLTISSLLISIRSLITDPNPNSPLEAGPAQLLLSKRTEDFNTKCKKWIVDFASGVNLGGLTVPSPPIRLRPTDLQWKATGGMIHDPIAAVAGAKSVKQPNGSR